MGVTKTKMEFVLSRGTPCEHLASPHVAVVDTIYPSIYIYIVYDALLGNEFIGVVGGCYDTYIGMSRYKHRNCCRGVQRAMAQRSPNSHEAMHFPYNRRGLQSLGLILKTSY